MGDAECRAPGPAQRRKGFGQCSEIGKRRLAAVEPEITRNRVARDESGALFVTGGARSECLAVQLRVFEIRREHEVRHRVVDGAGEHGPIPDHGHRHAPEGNPASEIRRPVDRVDIPLELSVARLAALLAHDRRVRLVLENISANDRLRPPVMDSYDVVQIGLVVHRHFGAERLEKRRANRKGCSPRSLRKALRESDGMAIGDNRPGRRTVLHWVSQSVGGSPARGARRNSHLL